MQALVWFGMAFSPMIPVVAMVSNILFYYTYYLLVRTTCRPPIKRWSQSSNDSLFMGLLGITMAFMTIPIIIAFRLYSPNCGPYENYDYDYIFSIIWIEIKVRCCRRAVVMTERCYDV